MFRHVAQTLSFLDFHDFHLTQTRSQTDLLLVKAFGFGEEDTTRLNNFEKIIKA